MAEEEGGEDPENPGRPKYDQTLLYTNVGSKLLDSFWEGYDVCMFAYGQSGAGKSFSMTGTGPKCGAKWKGVIPRICNDTFQRTAKVQAEDPNTKFRVTASMLEIYVGRIYDLLIPPEEYDIHTRIELFMQLDDVSGLSWLPVATEDDVTDLLVRGFGNQTKAPTGLNVDSSRGHTIFTLRMERIITNPKAKKKKDRQQIITTNMKLVDLAGSERTEKVLEITKEQLAGLILQKYGKPFTVSDKYMAEYKAERTTEGRSINNSLTTLGNCVKQVAKLSEIEDLALRKKKLEQIAWRSASLTRLLKSALNGRCKTMMIAAVSPSTTEYPETISTMRYAFQIKQIKSMAKKKVAKKTAEQIQEERIKELEALLASALEGGGGGGGGGGDGDPEELKKLEAEKAAVMKAGEEAKKREMEMEKKMAAMRKKREAAAKEKDTNNHLLTITDAENSVPVVLILHTDKETVAGREDQPDRPIILLGAGIRKDHCAFKNKGGTVTLIPGAKAACMVNGKQLKGSQVLKHNDRLRLGEHNFFRYIDCKIGNTEADDVKYNYNFVKEESMAELLAAFQLEDADAEKRRIEFEKEMKKQEEEMRKLAASQNSGLDQERAEHEMKLAEMKRKMKAAQKKAESDLLKASMSEHERQRKLKEAAEKAKEETDEMQKQQADFEAKMLKQKTELEAKLAEQEEFRKDMQRKENKARERAANQKAKVQYDLMDAIPQARQSSQYAKELGIPSKYTVKVMTEQSVRGLENFVCVQLTDEETEETQVWKMDEFRSVFGNIMQAYHDNVGSGRDPVLAADSGLKVVASAGQTIGYSKVLLNFIYFCMEVSDTFHVVDHTGKISGSVTIELRPLWASKTQTEEVEEAENLQQVKSLKFMDLEISIEKIEGLPQELARNVTVSFEMPPDVSATMLEDKANGLPEQKGGTHSTTVKPEYRDKVVINPHIGYKRVLRIHNMTYKVKEWFQTAELIVKVSGEAVAQDKAEVKARRLASRSAANENEDEEEEGDEDAGDAPPSAALAAKEAAVAEMAALKKKLAAAEKAAADGGKKPAKGKKGKKSSKSEAEKGASEDVKKVVPAIIKARSLLAKEEKLLSAEEKKLKELQAKQKEIADKLKEAKANEKAASKFLADVEKQKERVAKGEKPEALKLPEVEQQKREQEFKELQEKYKALEAMPKSKACSIQ